MNALVTGVPPPGLSGGLFRAKHGYLVFLREQTLFAQPLDLSRLQLIGESSPLADSVATAVNRGDFSLAENSLVYRVGTGGALKVLWLDRAGKPLDSRPPSFGSKVRVSPDGKHVAFVRLDPVNGAGDIWVLDVASRIENRFTSNPGYDWVPVWSPDGAQMAFASSRDSRMDLYRRSVDGTEPEQLLLKSDKRKIPTDWSRDSELLFFQQEEPTSGWDLWVVRMSGEPEALPVLQSGFDESGGALSPDGNWLAYTSDETGHDEVYVQRFPKAGPVRGTLGALGPRKRVSISGGLQPRWRSDGRELFYRTPDGRIVAVSIGTDPIRNSSSTTTLPGSRMASRAADFDIFPDGQRMVVTTRFDEQGSVPLTLILNWTAALRN